MSISSPEIPPIPKKFNGFQVLLIEPEITSLRHHEYILSQYSYRVTAITQASTGLSMILNGHTYDCVMVDGDIQEMNMVDFVHRIVKHQPQLCIIVMASNGIYSRIMTEVLKNEAIMCLLKPCGLMDICNILQHISRKRKAFKEMGSNGKSPEEDQDGDVVKRVIDPVVKQLATQGINLNLQEHGSKYKQVTCVDLVSDDDDDEHVATKKADKGKKPVVLNSAMINNNISSSKDIQEGLNINSMEHDTWFSEVTYDDLFSDDDDQERVEETTVDENISSGTTKQTDRGKQPAVVCKSTNHQPIEDEKKPKKMRINWTPELHYKFVVALHKIGKQKAYPRTILELMNVPGLTRRQINSHLQKHKERIRRYGPVPPMKGDINLQGLIVCRRCRHLNPCHNDASIFQSSGLIRSSNFNPTRTCYMNIDNISTWLQVTSQAPIPQLTTTAINNSGGVHATTHGFGKPFQPSMRERCMINTSGLVDNSNSGGRVNNLQMTGYGSRYMYEPLIVAKTVAMAPSGVVGDTVVPSHDLGMYGNNISYGFADGNSGTSANDSNALGALAPLDGFGNTINCSWVSGNGLGEALASPLGVSEIVAQDHGLVMDERSFWNGFDSGNSRDGIGNGVSEVHEPLDSFGIATDSRVTGNESAVYGLEAVMEPLVSETINNGHEQLARPEFGSCDTGRIYHQDFQGNGEDLFADFPDSTTRLVVENSINPSLPDLESDPFGLGSVIYSLPSFPGDEINGQAPIQPSLNSVISPDGSEVRVIDDGSFLDPSPDFERTVTLIDEGEGDLINGTW